MLILINRPNSRSIVASSFNTRFFQRAYYSVSVGQNFNRQLTRCFFKNAPPHRTTTNQTIVILALDTRAFAYCNQSSVFFSGTPVHPLAAIPVINASRSRHLKRPFSATTAGIPPAPNAKRMSISNISRTLEIRLTEQEAKICEVLDAVSKRYEEKEGKKVQLRIAGGWVRDKLLGLTCHDLDIGIDTMMGYDFALLVNDYMESIGQEKRSIAKIATNPEKSKHLETATMVVLGMPLDFVNLRSEVYDDASRIPSEITFGTPSEDAYRRDFTINALLYNIHTRTVEDFTERGLDDLKQGLVRTPLEPFETFWQDPLRVMRCIRFAARFNFKIVDEAKTAILDPRIKQALKTKISKERIGAELDKMIDDGAGRSTAIQLLHDLSLYDVVFAPPEIDGTAKGTTDVQGDAKDMEDAFKLVWIMEWLLKINVSTVESADLEGRIFQAEVDLGQESLLSQTCGSPLTTHLYPVVTSTPSPHVAQIISKDEPFPEKLGIRNLILAGMIYPYRDMTAIVNKKSMSAGSWILRYGLKGKNLDIDIVTKLMESIEPVRRVVRAVTQNPAMDEEGVQRERAEMGTVIRDIGFVQVIGKKWPCAFLLALGVDLIPRFDALRAGTLDEDTRIMIAAYNGFLSKAAAYHIDHCFAWKYLVDGKELTKMLNIKPGPKVTDYLRIVMNWQLRHPQLSKEECQAWILDHPDLFT